MKRKGAAVSVSLAIFAFIATLSIVEVGLDSFINIDDVVQAATIEFQATRFTTAAYAASALEEGSKIEIELQDEYTIYSGDYPSGAEVAMDEDNFVRPDTSNYPAVIHIGEDGFAPIGYGYAAFADNEATDQTWCIYSDGGFEPGDCS